MSSTLASAYFMHPGTPYTAVRHHDTKNSNHKFSEILQRIPSSSLLFTRTVILSTVHGVTATMEDPTVHIKAEILHIFLSLFPYLIFAETKRNP